MYIVVFEYDTTLGGLYGVRTIGRFPSKADFEKEIHRHQFIVAAGIDDQTATDLVALTPEICRYMAAIEDFFNNFPNPDALKLHEKLKAIREHIILSERKTIFFRDWERINAKPFVRHFKRMAERNPLSVKSFAILGALSTILDEDSGEVI